MEQVGRFFQKRPLYLIVLVLLGVLALPVAVWRDLENISDVNLERQARTLNSVISGVRSYYAENVVGRVVSSGGQTLTMHNYSEVDGAIPIPATLSIELGKAIGTREGNVSYRFVSDFPFTDRPPHNLTEFEKSAIARFREGVEGEQLLVEHTGSVWDHLLTVATPVVMSGGCVECHNSHEESRKHDWKVGDVRGIQTITVSQPISFNLMTFRWLLVYLLAAGSIGIVFAYLQFRLASSYSQLNDELEANNAFLAGISMKLSKYLSPQVYKSIFSGEKDVEISTDRKKLTVFFSDIKDFTATTERLQPEELTELLNEYFTEMAQIAATHGATIDKFIGDAIVAFFGDPETRGPQGDAQACVRMALDMQARLSELETEWRTRGLEHPFQARMGINTGYCNVGNFGSADRMDYTIIGAEANLAARMEGIAEPGGIVMSYETYSLVQDLVEAEPMPPARFKGVAREITPYRVTGAKQAIERATIQQAADGSRVTVALDHLDEATKQRVLAALQDALAPQQRQGG